MESAGAQGGAIFGMLFFIAVLLVMIIAGWKIFEKAGEPGWGVLVPIYNIVLMCKIAGKPTWWIVLFFIPFVNFIIGILLSVAMAEKFGKSIGFAIGLIILPFIFLPVLGFGDAQYAG